MQRLVLPDPETATNTSAVAALSRARAARLGKDLARAAQGRDHGVVLQSLDRFGRSSPEKLRELLSDPSVGVLVDTGNAGQALHALGFELACRRALVAPVQLEPRPLWSSSHDLSFEPGPLATRMTLENGAVSLGDHTGARSRLALERGVAREHEFGRLAASFPVIRGDVRLALFDPSPLSAVEAHPDKQGNALSLGQSPASDWIAALSRALELMEGVMPELFAEVMGLLRLVLPTGTDAERQQSASYREYVGALYITLHPQLHSTLEALIHEFQHNKLNLCAQHYELIENAYEPLYPSPIRPDPRPLMGVLLAAHAFVPVAELYRRLLAREGAHAKLSQRLSQVVAANDEALTTLATHARFTPVGEHVQAELVALHREHLALGLTLPERAVHVA